MTRPNHLGSDREEKGTEAGSTRDTPHVTSQDAQGRVQGGLPSSNAVPLQPANASGSDKQPVDQQKQPIDDESMYDNRPERDKNRPPSERGK
jgi:hypothetical protein